MFKLLLLMLYVINASAYKYLKVNLIIFDYFKSVFFLILLNPQTMSMLTYNFTFRFSTNLSGLEFGKE